MRYRGRGHLRTALIVVAVMAGLLAACTHSGQGAVVPTNGCAPPVNERLDPRSTVHLFPGAREPTYLSDPPTSGPHRPGPPFRGVVASSIPRASQVAMLESGYVILQSQGVPPAALEGLAGDLVTLARPAGPLPSPVVATAWTWKLRCGSAGPPAVTAIRAFIAAHQGVGFAGTIPTTTSPA